MEVKTQSCVVAGKRAVAVTEQILNGIIKEHSYKLPVAAFVGLTYIIIRKAKSAILQ
ncbi:hypothetical protein SEENP078_08348 [Salmonella enterica subsp. enterica serovar Newport str. RI_10P078]|nr:hypothetical protein SEENP078_08348 [Salmonella enterica subsp. enterica serovar Newport str. RI_10P078]